MEVNVILVLVCITRSAPSARAIAVRCGLSAATPVIIEQYELAISHSRVSKFPMLIAGDTIVGEAMVPRTET